MANIGTDWTQVDLWQSQQYDTYFGEYYYCQVRLLAKATTDVSNNKSKVDFKWQKRLSAWKTGRSAWNNTSYSWSITTAGHSASMTFALGTVNSTTWTDVGSSDYWADVGHGSDGTLTISAKANGHKFDGSAFSSTESLTLPTIPRASTSSVSPNPLTLSSANNTLTVTTNRASSSFTHTIKVICGSWNSTQTGVGASTTFSIPQTVVSQMSNTQMDCSVETTTYNGSSQIGSKTTTAFKVAVDTSQEHPVIGTVILSDTNPDTAAVETSGTFIKNASNLRVTIDFSVEGSYTTLASAQVSIDNVTSSYPLSGTTASVVFDKNKVNSNVLTIMVTDSRGYTVTKTQSLTIIPYEPIAFITTSIQRTNANGDPSDTGENISYDVEVKCFYGTFGQTENTLKLFYKSKPVTDQNYGSYIQTASASASGQGAITTYTFHGMTQGGFSSALEYDLVFKVEDIFSDAISPTIRIHEGLPVVGWGRDHFDVYGQFHIHDRADAAKYISFDANNPETISVNFSGAAGGEVNWTMFKFGNLRIAMCKWRSASNVTTGTAWGSLYSSSEINTPNFPITFDNVLYTDIRYIAADNNSTYAAFTCTTPQNTSNIKTNMGKVWLARPSSGSTIGHPTFVQVVVGTV